MATNIPTSGTSVPAAAEVARSEGARIDASPNEPGRRFAGPPPVSPERRSRHVGWRSRDVLRAAR